jgi:hypothetical protein
MTTAMRVSLALLLTAATTACPGFGEDQTFESGPPSDSTDDGDGDGEGEESGDADTDTDGGPQTVEEDIEEYNAVAAELESRRTEFGGDEMDEIQAVGGRLFWLQFPGWDPVLRSHDPATGQTTAYAFSIGGGDAYNYRASDEAVLTAIPDGDTILYRMYQIGQPESLLAEVEIETPQDEQRWWAYAIEGTTGYIVTTNDGVDLHRFTPGGELQHVLDLEADAGASVSVFWEFGIEGQTMIFVESGRIWELDLGSGAATWLGNETEVTGTVNFDTDGAAFGAADGLYYYEYASRSLTDIDQLVTDNGYRLNKTFASAHLHAGGDWTRRGTTFLYQGMSGIFQYDLATDTILPILLDPRLEPPQRLTYRNPQILRSGEIFVQGLWSESGAVGADGPIYRVDP